MAEPKIAGVRIRSAVNARPQVLATFRSLGLFRKNACAVLPETPSARGMFESVKDYVAYGNIDADTFAKLLEKKGGGSAITERGVQVFRLHPPTKGFRKSIKAHYPKGALGNWGEKISELLVRMI